MTSHFFVLCVKYLQTPVHLEAAVSIGANTDTWHIPELNNVKEFMSVPFLILPNISDIIFHTFCIFQLINARVIKAKETLKTVKKQLNMIYNISVCIISISL